MKLTKNTFSYACLKCGKVFHARWFCHRPYRFGSNFKTWVEKCRGVCSLSLPDGKCAYTRHVLICEDKQCV